jgi:hypothetical protein
MLEWALNNVTANGKYRMVLGNHDDAFIELCGRGDFQTFYSLAVDTSHHYTPNDDISHFTASSEKLYEYASFLASQPLFINVETNGKKYFVVHAWHPDNARDELVDEYSHYDTKADAQDDDKNNDDDDGDGYDSCESKDDDKANTKLSGNQATTSVQDVYQRRYRMLWERDIDESGSWQRRYIPEDGEILIHGHTPTLFSKNETHRGFAPGKVWDLGTSVNVDCGLVCRETKRNGIAEKYGNLAAYNLDTGEVVYLYDIPDDYATSEGEYYEDKMEREKRECEEAARKRAAAIAATLPHQREFYRQIYDSNDAPAINGHTIKASFNFLNDYFSYIIEFNWDRRDYKNDYDFDFKNNPMLAYVNDCSSSKQQLFANVKGRWHAIEIDDDFKYKVFMLQDSVCLLAVRKSFYDLSEVSVFSFGRDKPIFSYRMRGQWVSPQDAECIVDGEAKTGEIDSAISYRSSFMRDDKTPIEERPTGLLTADFLFNNRLYTVKTVACPGELFIARIVDCRGETIASIRLNH